MVTMYISDEVARDYLAKAVLLAFPLIGIAIGTWGFLWEISLLLAVFMVGRFKGAVTALAFLVSGYFIALIVYGFGAFAYLSFTPFAGVLGAYGWHKNWKARAIFFWGAALAGGLAALPAIAFVVQGFDINTVNLLIDSTIQQYKSTGLLEVMKQQGVNEAQLRDMLHQGLQMYALVIPGIAALISIVEFGVVFYLMRRWFKRQEWVPFTHWRLPWYAIWGAVLGIAAYLLGDYLSWPIIYGLGINLMFVYGAVAFVMGLSAYVFLLKSPKIPRLLKWMLVLVNFIFLLFSVISLIMYGLFDLVMNFRRLPEEL